MAGVVEQDVVGLHVPVQDVPAPEEVESAADLGADEPHHLLGEVERAAVHVEPLKRWKFRFKMAFV